MKKYLSVLCFAYSIIPMLLSAHSDLIKSFEIINKNKIVVKANKTFSKQFIKEDFFAEYDESIDLTKLDESIVTIPFILSIIPVVWISNETYSIDVMDKDLYHSLQKIKEVFQMFYPHHSWSGELIPKKLVTNTIGPSNELDQPALALLFTGGLDSVNTSISHVDTKQLLITAWGADVKVRENKTWTRVLEQCRKFSQTYGHDHTFVKSNLREFTEIPYLYAKVPRWWVHVSYVLSLAGLTAPLLVLRNISTLGIAATFTAEYPYQLGGHPAIDNNISFAGSSVYSTGSDKDREQKVMNINAICKEKELPLPRLRVCWSDPLGENCLECEKCIRTCVNIIAAGQMPREYGFNIDTKNVVQKLRKTRTTRKTRKTRKMRKIFLHAKKYFAPGKIHLWKRSLFYLNELVKHKTYPTLSNKKGIEELRNFLRSINFERYRNPRTPIYSPQKKKLFATLWKQNMKEVKI